MKVTLTDYKGTKLENFIEASSKMNRFKESLKPGMKVLLKSEPSSEPEVRELYAMAKLCKDITGNKLRITSAPVLRFSKKFNLDSNVMDIKGHYDTLDMIICQGNIVDLNLLTKFDSHRLKGMRNIYVMHSTPTTNPVTLSILDSFNLTIKSL